MTQAFELVPARNVDFARYKEIIPEFIRMTGPESYDYQFGGFDLLHRFVRRCWVEPENTYSHDVATLALEGEDIVGMSITYPGAEYYSRLSKLYDIVETLVAEGQFTPEEVSAVQKRAEHASYLNSHVPDDVYYMISLATPISHRGRGVGRVLMERALETARAGGYRSFHLDVLSNNPAVGFYYSFGMECAAEIIAPVPYKAGKIPMEMRLKLDLLS